MTNSCANTSLIISASKMITCHLIPGPFFYAYYIYVSFKMYHHTGKALFKKKKEEKERQGCEYVKMH